MSSNENRIARMHDRANEINKKRMRRKLQIQSVVTGTLGVCMIALAVVFGVTSAGLATTASTGYAGAAMLNVLAGNCIPVYVAAFLFGASLTFLIKTYREKKRQESKAL